MMNSRQTSRAPFARRLLGFGLLVSLVSQPALAFAQGLSSAAPSDSLDAKLQARNPGAIPVHLGNPSVAQGIGLAFESDDLKAIYATRGFTDCQTASVGPSPFAKDFSNFGSDCFKAQADRYYLTTDVRLRKSSTALARPGYGWNQAKPGDIASPAGTRFAGRVATQAAGANPFLKSLVAGKLDFGFSLGGVWGSLTAPSVAPARPRYVLKVVRVSTAPAAPVRVAGLGDFGIAFAQQNPNEDDGFEVGERSIVEVWDAPITLAPAPPVPMGVGGRFTRQIGVAAVPFTKFGLRLERRAAQDGGEAISARVAEGNDMVFAESSNLTGKSVLSYGYRLPYHRHSVTVTYFSKAPLTTTAYVFHIDDANRAWASYDASKKAYEAGFKRDI